MSKFVMYRDLKAMSGSALYEALSNKNDARVAEIFKDVDQKFRKNFDPALSYLTKFSCGDDPTTFSHFSQSADLLGQYNKNIAWALEPLMHDGVVTKTLTGVLNSPTFTILKNVELTFNVTDGVLVTDRITVKLQVDDTVVRNSMRQTVDR